MEEIKRILDSDDPLFEWAGLSEKYQFELVRLLDARITAADALAKKAERLLECIRMGWPQGHAAMVLHAALREYREVSNAD